MDLEKLKKQFVTLYGTSNNIKSYFSPGRVNLIGDHVDYNGGLVFPCALDIGTYGLAEKTDNNILSFASTNTNLKVSVNLNDLEFKKEHSWSNYLKGVAVEFLKLNKNLGGLNILISGNIPNSSGLSSSASIELLMSIILNDMFNCNLNMVEMIKVSVRAENDYVGVNSGIMDQFAVGMGKKDNGILLNCDTLEYEYIPIILKKHKLIIGNTNKRRALTDSKYNERCAECEKAVEYLNTKLNIKLLSEMTIQSFEKHKYLIEDETVLKRATHVIYEIDRTYKAADELKSGNLKEFGKLMTASHNSLKDLYDVTGFELDTLVNEGLKVSGCLGSRMTGAGFGGCTVSLVENESVDEFINTVSENYLEKVGWEPSFYDVKISDGAKKID